MKRLILSAMAALALAGAAGTYSDRLPSPAKFGGMGDPTVWCPPFCGR